MIQFGAVGCGNWRGAIGEATCSRGRNSRRNFSLQFLDVTVYVRSFHVQLWVHSRHRIQLLSSIVQESAL